jgi:hypothetical protein
VLPLQHCLSRSCRRRWQERDATGPCPGLQLPVDEAGRLEALGSRRGGGACGEVARWLETERGRAAPSPVLGEVEHAGRWLGGSRRGGDTSILHHYFVS